MPTTVMRDNDAPRTISLLMPTRARVPMALRFLESVAARTHDLDHIEVVMYVDDDDPASHELRHDGVTVTHIIGPSTTMGAFNMACLERSRGRIIVLVNDDVVMRTDGWDDRVRELDRQFEDGIYLAYGDDLFKGKRISTFPILSRRACDVLVTPYPRVYKGGLIDYHLFDIFKRLEKRGHHRIRFLQSVIFEHMHYRTGKTAYDGTYGRRGRWDDDATFLALGGVRQAAADRLAAAIAGDGLPDWAPDWPTGHQPATLTAAVAVFARAFLADRGLPTRWRAFLFTWYCGRYVAARGFLLGRMQKADVRAHAASAAVTECRGSAGAGPATSVPAAAHDAKGRRVL
jgi:hypothetical protein